MNSFDEESNLSLEDLILSADSQSRSGAGETIGRVAALFPRRTAAASRSGQAVLLTNWVWVTSSSSSAGSRARCEPVAASGPLEMEVGCRERERRRSMLSGAVSLKSWRFSATFLPAVEEGRMDGVEVEAEEEEEEEIDECEPSLEGPGDDL